MVHVLNEFYFNLQIVTLPFRFVEIGIENSMPLHGKLKAAASTWETSVMEAVVANQTPTAIHTGGSLWRNHSQTLHQVRLT